MRVLLTGASGFLGGGLAAGLRAAGHGLVMPVRGAAGLAAAVEGARLAPPLEGMAAADWRPLLAGVDAVVHAAAIAHIGKDVPRERYMAVNRDASAVLAAAAAAAGIGRFVFISSIRAQVGPSSPHVQNEDTPPAPTEAYGQSKLEAERLISAALPAAVHLRPALIVGGAPRANLALLARLAASPLPLPFGLCRAPQAAIARENLIDAVLLALDAPAMAGRTFVAADDPHPTIADMLAWMREGAGRSPRLVPVPEALLGLPLRLLGKGDAFDRITGGLAVDSAGLRAAGWRPRTAIADAFRALGRAA
jgi:UDP-glucose 4-epimerase